MKKTVFAVIAAFAMFACNTSTETPAQTPDSLAVDTVTANAAVSADTTAGQITKEEKPAATETK